MTRFRISFKMDKICAFLFFLQRFEPIHNSPVNLSSSAGGGSNIADMWQSPNSAAGAQELIKQIPIQHKICLSFFLRGRISAGAGGDQTKPIQQKEKFWITWSNKYQFNETKHLSLQMEKIKR